jgi:hypothetical protein
VPLGNGTLQVLGESKDVLEGLNVASMTKCSPLHTCHMVSSALWRLLSTWSSMTAVGLEFTFEISIGIFVAVISLICRYGIFLSCLCLFVL